MVISLHVLLRRGVAGDDGVVQPVHAHADRAAALDVGLLQQHARAAPGLLLLRLDRGHRAGGAAADHKDIGFDLMGNWLIHLQVRAAKSAM